MVYNNSHGLQGTVPYYPGSCNILLECILRWMAGNGGVSLTDLSVGDSKHVWDLFVRKHILFYFVSGGVRKHFSPQAPKKCCYMTNCLASQGS